ncbi:acyltransferase family protein [Prosthecomicrobium sp. N25]|uniref:acyltransferase family protein n=1 Tax=Prosthecomicrobium sp. N25 TaxID=3129254 RepID=UPI003077608F
MTDHAARIARAALARSLAAEAPPPVPAAAVAAAARKAAAKPAAAERLPGLDGLRVVAVLAVVAFHLLFRGPVSGWTGVPFPAVEGVAAYGYAGVDLFFVISGFVIAWSSEGRSPLAFARARLLRLWPAFVVCMTVTALVLALARDPNFPIGPAMWVANLIFLPQLLGQPFVDGAYWSIVTELTFYGWVFLAMALGLWPRRIAEIGLVWLAVSLVNLFLGSAILDRLFLTSFAGEFLGGVVLYRIRAEGQKPILLALLTASVFVAVVHSVPYSGGLDRLYGFKADPAAVVLVHFAIFGLVAAAAAARVPARLAGLTLAAGGATYPAYLLHQNIGYVLIDRLVPAGVPGPLAALLITAGVFGLAWVVWARIEPAGRRLLAPILDRAIARLPAAIGGGR